MHRFIFWLILILALNFFIHLYVFFKVSIFWSGRRNVILYILSFFTSLLIIPATILLEWNNNFISQLFYSFSWLLMGVFFVTCISLLIFQIIGGVCSIHRTYLTAASLILSLIIVIYSFINAGKVDVKTVDIDNFGKKLKIVQVTDLHLDPLTSSKRLPEIVERINSLKPDIVAITGDIVSHNTLINPITFAPLKNIEAKTYFISGNHEHYIDKDKVLKLIENTGVKVLIDEVDFYKGVQVIGIDYKRDKNKVDDVLSELKLDKKTPALLLLHVPMDVRDERVKLILSGHTHYGQIVPFNFIVRTAFKYMKGLYPLENGYIYVSPGTGTWGPHMRLGSKNEITLFFVE
ncbi:MULTISPECIES: metallophosphoesterase [Psychrilyobacter]|nr:MULTISPECIES: metallophosphoesterase [Psychrilyobacter]MCS5420375.1 metallophosphoesterase [Psychrilyobacter sp. S5]NDI76379.1 metallophosphoesterase [Psychrilyobacter piezotolerans]